MLNLNIETGLKEYNLNGKVTLYINPTDPVFIENVFNAMDKIDSLAEAYKARIEGEESPAAVFEIARERDKEIRAIVDNALGAEVCTPLFGTMSVCATGNGLPLWANLLLTLVDEVDNAMEREKAATNPRIRKYTEKFSRKR